MQIVNCKQYIKIFRIDELNTIKSVEFEIKSTIVFGYVLNV